MDPRASRYTSENNTIHSSCHELNHNPVIAQSIAYPTYEKTSLDLKHKINNSFTTEKSEAWTVNH
jgi:hypothetical protein